MRLLRNFPARPAAPGEAPELIYRTPRNGKHRGRPVVVGVRWRGLEVRRGDDVVVEWLDKDGSPSLRAGLARVMAVFKSKSGSAVMYVRWYYFVEDLPGKKRTADYHEAEVYQHVGNWKSEEIAVETVHFKVTVWDGLAEFLEHGGKWDFFVNAWTMFKRPKLGQSEPQPFKVKRNVLHVANMKLTEPPEEVIAQLPTARMPFVFGVGLKAWEQPDGAIVLPTTTGAAKDGQQRGYPLRECLLEPGEYVLDLGREQVGIDEGADMVAACVESERRVAGCLAGSKLYRHVTLVAIEHSAKLYRPPAEAVHTLVARYRKFVWSGPSLPRIREQQQASIFERLLKRVEAHCRSLDAAERTTVQIDASALDATAVDLFAEDHQGRWLRGRYELKLSSHARLPLVGAGRHFFSIASLAAIENGHASDKYAEIVSPATTRADAPQELVLFTDFQEVVGLRFSWRVWHDVVGTGMRLARGPALPSDDYDPMARPGGGMQ